VIIMKTSKLTVTISKESYERIEREKKRQGLTRSALVDHMIDFYFEKVNDMEKEKRYIEGYKNIPEHTEEIAVLEVLEASALGEF